MPLTAPPEYIRAFADSMPDGYRDRHDALAVAAHAAVARARGDRPAHVGIVGHGGPGEVAVCVVARDRPGLLSTISAAFVLSGMDVVAAEAFTRIDERRDPEAVDLFWIRRQQKSGGPRPITDGDAEGIASLLVGWAEFHRGFNDPTRPVPLREIDIHPSIGPGGDGGRIRKKSLQLPCPDHSRLKKPA